MRFPDAHAGGEFYQPYFVNSPLGIYLIHDGNLTNASELRASLEGGAAAASPSGAPFDTMLTLSSLGFSLGIFPARRGALLERSAAAASPSGCLPLRHGTVCLSGPRFPHPTPLLQPLFVAYVL